MSTNDLSTELPYWDRFRDTAMGRHLLGREQAFIRQTIEQQTKPLRLLEICACGGRVALPLRDRTSLLVALDLDYQGLTLFRERSGGLPAVMADAQDLPFVDGSFNCLVAIQCLRYFDQERFLRGCYRVLSHDGWLVIQAVNRKGYKRRLKELVRSAKRDEDPRIFGTQEVLRMVTEAGFEVRQIEGYNWPPLLADSHRFSDTSFVSLMGSLASRVGLGRFYNISPWILVAAKKMAASGVHDYPNETVSPQSMARPM